MLPGALRQWHNLAVTAVDDQGMEERRSRGRLLGLVFGATFQSPLPTASTNSCLRSAGTLGASAASGPVVPAVGEAGRWHLRPSNHRFGSGRSLVDLHKVSDKQGHELVRNILAWRDEIFGVVAPASLRQQAAANDQAAPNPPPAPSGSDPATQGFTTAHR